MSPELTHFRQAEFDVRCEWGPPGIRALAPYCDVVVIVDILSFTTCVEIATARGAVVYPYRWRDVRAAEFAREEGALLAGSRGSAEFSLSPASLTRIPPDTRLVLPSPNGSTLSLATGNTPTLAACLRNAEAVARTAQEIGNRIGIVPAGERWPDGRLRPSWEDWIGAGAILAHLRGQLSPEARAAREAYRAAHRDLCDQLHACGSGKELIAAGYSADVELAGMLNVGTAVPTLRQGAFTAA